jgi:hypothetical protein
MQFISMTEFRRVIIAGTENSCMAGFQEHRYEELFDGFFFDEDALRYRCPNITDKYVQTAILVSS